MSERYEQKPKPKDVETLRSLIYNKDLREAFTIPPTPDKEKKESIIEKTIQTITEKLNKEGSPIDEELLHELRQLAIRRVEFISTLLEELNKKAEHQGQSEIFKDVTSDEIEDAVNIEKIS